jgi:DNA-binding CsgD family transcriptional regulator/PAS domain-containing protein
MSGGTVRAVSSVPDGLHESDAASAEVEVIEKLLSRIYGIASGDVGWTEVLGELSAMFDREPVMSFVLDAQNENTLLLGTSLPNLARVPEPFLQVARRAGRRLKARIPTTGVVGARFPRTQRHIIEELASWNSLADLESGYVAGRLLRIWESAYLCFAIGPDEPGHAVPLRHRALVDILLPHLARAAELERRLQNASAQFNVFSQILDRLSIAVLSLDRDGAVTHLNAAALRLSEGRGGLIIARAGIHATTEASETQLQRCIAEAIANEKGDYYRRLNVSSRRGPSCGIVVMSIYSDGSSSQSRSRCVLFISDPDQQPPVNPIALCDFLGLTAAEARVVAEVVMGLALPEAAKKVGVTPNTARTLLARAMARTGTNSQIAIVRKVLSTLVPVAEEM